MLGVALVLVATSIFLAVADRWLSPVRIAGLAAAFQILGALAVAIFENAVPWDRTGFVRGVSWVALWVAVCTLVIPQTPLRALVLSLISASMAWVGHWLAHWWWGHPILEWNRMLVWLAPVFLMAFWASFLNRRLFAMSADIERARELGGYHLEAQLGQGGMGEVWRARHRMLARDAAIKLIRPEVLASHSGREGALLRKRFEQEARSLAQLRSPHTVELYDFGVTEEGRFYYVMELLDGLDFESLTKQHGPQPAPRVVHLIRQACESLGEAHWRGLVHRDIKPTNLFLCRLGLEYDFVKVLDFGLVKRLVNAGETRMTAEGIATGTPAYMAPEVAVGRPDVDARADVYGLGLVAYYLLTGQHAFDEPTPMATVLAQLQKPPTPPSQRTEVPVPPELERIVLRCLEKQPEKRPADARELARLLEECRLGAVWTPADAEHWWNLHLPVELPRLAEQEVQA